MTSLNAIAKVFVPFGYSVNCQNPWLHQKHSNDSRLESAALSIGESNIIKYGLNFPVRSGLDLKEDFSEYPYIVTYLPSDGEEAIKCQFEEFVIYNGVCVYSKGPLGGPSQVLGLYRPLPSYGTGSVILQVVKTTFLDDINNINGDKDSYICLVEKSGISLYAENSSDTQVIYMSDFEIEKVVSCFYGLIFIPSNKIQVQAQMDSELEELSSKSLYILTNPLKQVSKVWLKVNSTDFIEYDNSDEVLLSIQDNVCVFWNINNQIYIRKLIPIDHNDYLHNATFHSTTTAGSSYQFESFNFPSTSYHAQFSRPQQKPMRVNKEGSTISYWPSFNFSNASLNNDLAVGFYPPHVCVYDDPEVYMSTICKIELAKGYWKQPHKCQFVLYNDNRIAIWCLIQRSLYLFSANLSSGTPQKSFCIKNVNDFVCPSGKVSSELYPFIIILDAADNLKILWLDDEFDIVCWSTIDISLPPSDDLYISSLEHLYFGDTLICTLEDSFLNIEMIKIELPNFMEDSLTRIILKTLKGEIPSNIYLKIYSGFMGIINEKSNENCNYLIIQDVIRKEPVEVRFDIGLKIFTKLHTLKEDIKSRTCSNITDNLTLILTSLLSYTRQNLLKEIPYSNLFKVFAELLLEEDPTSNNNFFDMPKVMQLLLKSPDSQISLNEFVKLKEDNKLYSPCIEILIADVFHRNRCKVTFNWNESLIEALGRTDYLSGIKGNIEDITTKSRKTNDDDVPEKPTVKSTDEDEELNWAQNVLAMRVFTEDRRLEEVCRLLDSSTPISVDLEQRVEMSDHEYVEEQEKYLLQLVQVTFASAVGRAGLTLKTEVKNHANLTSLIYIPKICYTGKCAIKGTTIELKDETDLPSSYTAWPTFHNAVASSLSVRFNQDPADAWFAYNKSKTTEGPDQAGMILGFGLNKILGSMPPTLRHEYLAKENSFTTMAMLLGLAANYAGTGDLSIWKLISLHIGAMLPACTTELEIPRFATLAAPFSLGLLFMGTHNSHISKVLLGEISKRYSPLSVFGSNVPNNSASNINIIEASGIAQDREAHSLCAGLGLGFVSLGKGKTNTGLEEDGFDGILRRFVVGGPKPAYFTNNEEDEVYNQFGQSLPSLWEEYRCCHIEEGDNVNVDVTTPSAIVAVSLIYLRSGNEAVLKWLSPPTTTHLLDGVRPDLLLLRSLAMILVFEKIENPEVTWLESHLMPDTLIKSALKKPDKNSRIDLESINQAWSSIICGYCLGLGIRFAGTSDTVVKKTLWHYINLILNISSSDSKLSEYFPKNFLESILCNLTLALSLNLAGTGDIPTLRICRYLQNKVASTQITSTSNTYGLEMCISMAIGFLYLGGGRYSLSNDDQCIGALLAAVFPKWPINANDNRYHLQALRHMYVLAAQPRLILPKQMPHSTKIKFFIESIDGKITETYVPVLLPPFHLIKKIWMDDAEFYKITFELPKDLKYLKKIVEGGGSLTLVPKPIGEKDHGFLSKMSWREEFVFHGTFSNERVSADEVSKIKDLNLISRMTEWVGLRSALSSFLALKNGDKSDENWIWQIKILYRWILRSRMKGVTTALRPELLAHLNKKNEEDFHILSDNLNFSLNDDFSVEDFEEENLFINDENQEPLFFDD